MRTDAANRQRASNRAGEERYMDVRRAAAYLGVTPAAMYHLIAKRAITFIRLGRRILIDRLQMDEDLRRRAITDGQRE